jgi:hypothetical protein
LAEVFAFWAKIPSEISVRMNKVNIDFMLNLNDCSLKRQKSDHRVASAQKKRS